MELVACKDGEIQWRTHISVLLTWITMFKCLGSLMAMEVNVPKILINNMDCVGREVALYVKDVYINELKKLKSFQNKDYGTALEESFIKIDELLKSPQG